MIEVAVVVAHDRFAVVDSPAGLHLVSLPTRTLLARDLRRAHSNFWCSTRAGGCGGLLDLKAGPIRAPYFAHRPGEGTGCAARLDPDELTSGYEHLTMQLALRTWLRSIGYDAHIERPVGGGRADVHAVAGDQIHVIEVQRSPLPPGAWEARDAKYRSEASTVTWLWGTDRKSEAEYALVSHDVAFHARITEGPSVEVGTLWPGGDGEVDGVWNGLEECRLDGGGLWTPRRDTALKATQAWRLAQAQAQVEQIAHQERVRGEEADRARQWELRRDAGLARLQGQDSGSVAQGQSRHALWRRRQICPDLDGWNPEQGWGWLDDLPVDLHESARHLAYYVYRLVASGTVSDLSWSDVPDPTGLQRDALVREEQ